VAITSVKIHPAIGVARLGNSPGDFFIGPERIWDPPHPAGGFKDGQCRIKRQAARFRVFAYHDDDTVTELTAADADISWTVHLANKKVVTRFPGGGSASDLTIDPGPRTLTGPDQHAEFDDGTITLPGASAITVPLGEVRTDDHGRLLVLGGFGTSASPTSTPITSFYENDGWYDDISDGPVTAHVKVTATGDEFDAVGAWVLVAPPKFAPELESPTTLFDRVFQLASDQGWVNAPAQPSYTDDIYPILLRARNIHAVRDVMGAHTSWAEPAYDATLRQTIFARLRDPGGTTGDMPDLNGEGSHLTPVQYGLMQAWSNGQFAQDWAGPPAPPPLTPAALDEGPLRAAVGSAFFPGIEAGGHPTKPILDATLYLGAADPMRLDHTKVGAGDMSRFMALPWQADFNACSYGWWPVPRPNDVIPQGTTSYQAWDRTIGSAENMVAKWHTLGFVLEQGGDFFEVERCDTSFIQLLTPHLAFQDVPQGPMGMSRKTALAVSFEVMSTGSAVTLEVKPADMPTNTRLTLAATSVTVGPTVGNAVATARLWVIYETGAVGESITDQLVVSHVAGGETWTVTISANTVARKVGAAVLVLDRSGSMAEDAGDGQSKHDSLTKAGSIFVDVMLEGDAIGIVRFNEDAQPLQSVTPLGPAGDPLDLSRQNTKDVINGTGLQPGGSTSIGDGIFEGRQLLNSATGTYDVKSLVVLTDGVENEPRWIADVAAEINELTYAVGLGLPQNISTTALQTISGNNGGYLLITGAIAADNRFLLQKYFLQILAGISNAEIVLDPDGVLVPGTTVRIPFQLTEADAGADVILLTPYPRAVDFRLQTPNGFLLDPVRARTEPGMAYTLSDGVTYYRIALPVELYPGRFEQPGTWHAVLRIGKPRDGGGDGGVGDRNENVPLRARFLSAPPQEASVATTGAATQGRGLPYSLVVHSYSNLSLRATIEQSHYVPGAKLSLHALLAESGVPARKGSRVWAEVTRPDGGTATVNLQEHEHGQFAADYTTGPAGIYRFRVRAAGVTSAGYPFRREQLLTAAVWRGGDQVPPSGGGSAGWERRLCDLLHCLTGDVLTPDVEKRLREQGVDLARLRRCLDAYCKAGRGAEPR
jgi:L-lysine epsilon oxidase-like protein/von Willebrand factor type A domain-containing protein